jgi:AhpD family alkylhydroperoxidase
MKPNNQKALDDFLSRADEMGDDLLADTEEMLGSLPFIFTVLKERPEYFALTAIADEMVCRPPHLTAKTAELVAIAAAAGAGADNCLRVHMQAAVKEGADREEIYDAILIAALIGKTRVLGPALRELRSAFPENAGQKRKA